MSIGTHSRFAVRRLLSTLAALALCAGCARQAIVPDLKELSPPAIEAPAPAPGEAPAPPTKPAPEVERGDPDLGGRIVAAARRHLDQPFRGDCSGFVKRVLADVGVQLPPSGASRTATEALSQSTRPTGRPHPGDLAFFHDTYDRNRDGLRNDPWSHVAIVESVEGDQLTLIHRGGSGVARILMDLERPTDSKRNSTVRVHRRRDPPGTLYLTGELSAGFGVVVPAGGPIARHRGLFCQR